MVCDKIKKNKIPYYRRTLGYVFQDYKLFPNMTVFDNVAFAMHVIGEPKRRITRRVTEFLKELNLDKYAGSYPNELSGGEQRRVALARALVNDPKIVIADEPTNNSDMVTAVEMMDLLVEINKLGKTVIVITHDLNIVSFYKKRVLTITEGLLVDDNKQNGGEVENEQ